MHRSPSALAGRRRLLEIKTLTVKVRLNLSRKSFGRIGERTITLQAVCDLAHNKHRAIWSGNYNRN